MSPYTSETLRHLQALLRLDTTNPPGNETLAAEYLAGVLRAEGFEPVVLESAPGRGHVITRYKGTGAAPPLLLYSHTDVVPAEPSQWTHPPFAGEVADGYVWGRGALDMKDIVAQQLMVMLLLKRNQVQLKRDIIFAATADEEIGGANGYGMAWLAKHHPDLLRAEFGLSEVGGYNVNLGGQQVYLIQTAEKGTCWFKLRAKGQPGHGSLPHTDNAVVHLAKALNILSAGLPYHLCQAAQGFLGAAQAVFAGTPSAALFAALQSAETGPAAFAQLTQPELRRFLNPMLHNTATPTGLRAGQKTNVIPSVAEATIDGRLLPGFTPETFFEEVENTIGPGYHIEPELIAPPIEASHDTALFRLISETILRHDPAATHVLPYMMSGATDAKYLAPLGIPTYGFAPIKLPPDMPFMELFHAHDERAPISGLGWGVEVLYEVVKKYGEMGEK